MKDIKETIEIALANSYSGDWWTKDDEETPYVGWLDNEGNISLIFPNIVLFKVCFPYGYKAEEEAGTGRMIRVFIREVYDKNN